MRLDSILIIVPTKKIKMVLLLICLCSFFIGAFQVYKHVVYKNKMYEVSRQELQELTYSAAKDIDILLTQVISSAEKLADRITTEDIRPKEMHVELKKILEANQNYHGGTVTFKPYGFDPNTNLYSVYYSRSGHHGELTYSRLDEVYDYTSPDYDWYVKPMESGNGWSEPYWDEAGKTYMITYSALFYKVDVESGDRHRNGVVTIDISMKQIKNIIESLNIGPSGFGALTTQEGNYLYHPNSDYVLSHMSIKDVAEEKNDPDRLKLAQRVERGESGVINHVSTTTGQESWLIFAPVPISGWSLQNTFIKDDLQLDLETLRQQIILITIVAIVFIASLIMLLLRVHKGQPVSIWIASIFVSLLLLAGIGVVWNLALSYHTQVRAFSHEWDGNLGIKISDRLMLDTLKHQYDDENVKKSLPLPIYIPTGIYIDAMELNGSNIVSVTGQVWQEYPLDFPENIQKGFQIASAKNTKIVEADSRLLENSEVVRWRFQAEINTQFDYSRYPLETEHIGIQLRPQSSSRNIFMVPDLASYKMLTPTQKPGLAVDLFIPGWEITDTFFMLKKNDENTNFGIERNFDQERFPYLNYEIGIKRIFVDAFISNLTPLIVVAIILFSLLLLPLDIDISRLLGICVSVFFVVVFSHLAIRRNIAIGEIFYLEYIFFVIYFAILAVPVNAFRVALKIPSKIFGYKNGLIPKVIYWPSILGIFFVITVMKFY